MADDPADGAPDPMARLSDRAEDYASLWRSAIERNAAGTYKPEDWFDDVNRAWAMAAEDAADARRRGRRVSHGVRGGAPGSPARSPSPGTPRTAGTPLRVEPTSARA